MTPGTTFPSAEASLKARLVNKLALEAETKGLDAAALAKRSGFQPALAEKLLDGDVTGIALFDVVVALTSVGLNVQFSTAPASGEAGQILYDLDDAA